MGNYKVKLDSTEYKKFIGLFELEVFGTEGDSYRINDSECIILSKDIDTAKFTLIYEMMHNLMLEGVPVVKIELLRVIDCESGDEIIIRESEDSDDNIFNG